MMVTTEKFSDLYLASDGYAIGTDDPVTTVYGRLLWHHMDVMRKGDEAKRKRVFEAIELFDELWPAEVKVWNDRYDDKRRPQDALLDNVPEPK